MKSSYVFVLPMATIRDRTISCGRGKRAFSTGTFLDRVISDRTAEAQLKPITCLSMAVCYALVLLLAGSARGKWSIKRGNCSEDRKLPCFCAGRFFVRRLLGGVLRTQWICRNINRFSFYSYDTDKIHEVSFSWFCFCYHSPREWQQFEDLKFKNKSFFPNVY